MAFVFSHPLLGPDSPLLDEEQAFIAALMTEEAASRNGPPALDREALVANLAAQPAVVAACLEPRPRSLPELTGSRFDRVYCVGTGPGLAIAHALRPLFEEMLGGVACEPIDATELAYYGRRALNARSLVILVSVTDREVRLLEAAVVARRLGATTLCISTGTDRRIEQWSGFTLGKHVPHTPWPLAGVSAGLALALRLALDIGRQNGVAETRLAVLETAVSAIPGQMAGVLAGDLSLPKPTLAGLAIAGSGPMFGAAMIGAELCTRATGQVVPVGGLEGWSNALPSPDTTMVLFVANGLSVRRAGFLLDHARDAGRTVMLVTAEDSPLADGAVAGVVRLPAMIERLAPIVYMLAGQRLALDCLDAKMPAPKGP